MTDHNKLEEPIRAIEELMNLIEKDGASVPFDVAIVGIVGRIAIDLMRIANALEVIADAHSGRVVGDSAFDSGPMGQGGGRKSK